MHDADIAVRERFKHLPSAESILNGAVVVPVGTDVYDLHVLAIQCIIILEKEYSKYGKINIYVHHRLEAFCKLYNIIPGILSKNIKEILIDIYGDIVVSYLTQTKNISKD